MGLGNVESLLHGHFFLYETGKIFIVYLQFKDVCLKMFHVKKGNS